MLLRKQTRLLPLFLLTAFLLSLSSLNGCSQSREGRETLPYEPTESEVFDTQEPTTSPKDLPMPPISEAETTQAQDSDTQTPVTEPSESEARVSFTACGDNIMYYGNVREATEKGKNGQMDFRYTYDRIRSLLKDADICFVNQENIISESRPLSYYPCFNVPVQVGEALLDCGVDIVNLANNHMLDQTEAGLREAISYWRSSGVFTVGDYLSEDEYDAIRIYEKNGISIAFLSYTYGTNGLSLQRDSEIVIPYLREDDLRRQISAAKASADFLFVSVHWGTENDFQPSAQQRYFASLMNESGVDVILGHHPHVIQPVQVLDNENGNRTLCFYSLGNLTGEMAQAYNMVGGIASFDLVKNGEERTVENVLFTPTVYYFDSSFHQNTVCLMSEFTEAMAESHGIAYYGNSMTLSQIRGYVTDTIDKAFLPPDFLTAE